MVWSFSQKHAKVYFIIAVVALLVSSSLLGVYAEKGISDPSTNSIQKYAPLQPCAYYVFNDTSTNTVAAESCTNGTVVYGGPGNHGGDNGTEAQTVLQSAIDSTFSSGGGTIQIAAGQFDISSSFCAAQLSRTNGLCISIPWNSNMNPLVTIKIIGQGAELYQYQTSYPDVPPSSGSGITIIYTAGSGTASGSAVFGSAYEADGVYASNVNIILEDLTFRVNQGASEPVALSLDHFAGFDLERVAVDVFTPTGVIAAPTTGIGISINEFDGTSGLDNDGLATLNDVYVVGYNIGILIDCQHLVTEQLFVQFCTYGIYMGGPAALQWWAAYLDVEQCTYPIDFNNYSIYFMIDFLFLQSQGPWSSTNWFNAKYYFSGGSGIVSGSYVNYYITGGTVSGNALTDGSWINCKMQLVDASGSAGVYTSTSPLNRVDFTKLSNAITTSSSSLVEAGLGITLVPSHSGAIMIDMVLGRVSNSVAGDGVRAAIQYGTGPAPSEGAAETGVEGFAQPLFTSTNAGDTGEITLYQVVTGLTQGTQYWFDFSFSTAGGGMANVQQVTGSVAELY
ncbi:MAG: hypothetical protein PXY39_00380 [archaeon]|nr:hypothetical protein [archaeon]